MAERKGMRARIEDLISKGKGKPSDVAEEVDAEGNVTSEMPEGAVASTAQTPAEDARTLSQLEQGQVSKDQALSQIDPEMFAGQKPEAFDLQTAKAEALSRAMGDVETWTGAGDWSYEKHERPNGEVYIIASKGDTEAIVEPGDISPRTGKDMFKAIMLEREDPEAFAAGDEAEPAEPATPSAKAVLEAEEPGAAEEAEPTAEETIEDLGESPVEPEPELGESFDPERVVSKIKEGVDSGAITAVGNNFDPVAFGSQVSAFLTGAPASSSPAEEELGESEQGKTFEEAHGRSPRTMAELQKFRNEQE
jgi:hypothetical protein